MLLAAASEALGDHDTASLERDAATAAFRELNAAGNAPATAPGGLTPRELEVLLLAAEGRSNSDIAEALVLSIRTVERHLATVYSKLGFEGRNARAAAVSFALRQGLGSRTPVR
jgi:DNA-binding NarL/FixJ family response regulator